MLSQNEQRCVCELSLDQHWLQWGGRNKAGPFRLTMGTLSARTGEGRGNKQHTRVSQTTCHKAFSRTGLTGTPSSHPAPGVRQGSPLWCIVGEVWQAEGVGERDEEEDISGLGYSTWLLHIADFWHVRAIVSRWVYVRSYYVTENMFCTDSVNVTNTGCISIDVLLYNKVYDLKVELMALLMVGYESFFVNE